MNVIKANYHPASGIYYYITFEAEHEDVGSKNFQAFVRFFMETPTVEFCRIEEPPKGTSMLDCFFFINVH